LFPMRPMKLATARRWLSPIAVALTPWSGGNALCSTDPLLNVTLVRTGTGVVLNWVGFKSVPYQVEGGSELTGWANASPVLTGRWRNLGVHELRLGT
jgi:hypothetical protein